ncbi:MAG TPA: RAMP superfamily CRISPR-associated protein [Blastocatellia bacterium]|nr:RAMP superfamily CRISPR-associated protein [Blastocatellia bacterium]
MTRLDITYRIYLATPMHIGTGMGFAKMIDDMVTRAGPAKGEGARLPCIPGSSIKGKARSRCEALANTLRLKICGARKCKMNPCIVCRIFGTPFSPGGLQFSDALLHSKMSVVARLPGSSSASTADPFALGTVRAGNKLERPTRTVEPDFLFSIEHTADQLQYEGSIKGQVDDRNSERLNIRLPLEGWLLTVGLLSVDKVGGSRSRGMGRCRITIAGLVVEGREEENLAGNLTELLAEEDYLLGLSEYEA